MSKAYEKRLGWLNVEQKPADKFDGKVHKFMTKNGVPVILPDDNEYNYPVEHIPEDVQVVKLFD